jgi:hypothetical protein
VNAKDLRRNVGSGQCAIRQFEFVEPSPFFYGRQLRDAVPGHFHFPLSSYQFINIRGFPQAGCWGIEAALRAFPHRIYRMQPGTGKNRSRVGDSREVLRSGRRRRDRRRPSSCRRTGCQVPPMSGGAADLQQSYQTVIVATSMPAIGPKSCLLTGYVPDRRHNGNLRTLWRPGTVVDTAWDKGPLCGAGWSGLRASSCAGCMI